MSEEKIKYAGEPRRASIVKTCETCGVKYHPRANGYEYTSKFCSQACLKKGRKKNRPMF